jgi:hypothetical protein
MECNVHTLHITKNLGAALKDIRSSSEVVKLWVDAICINQDHLAEKNHQVKNMGSIYWMAERVLVWLGPER